MEHFPKSKRPARTERSNNQLIRQAEERNTYRSLFEKIFGVNKTSGMDVLKEEADRVNELVDTKVLNEGGGSYQDAADDILESEEFRIGSSEEYLAVGLVNRQASSRNDSYRQKTIKSPSYEDAQNKIEFKEFLNSQNPQIEKAIEAGSLAQGIRFVEEIKEHTDEGQVFEDGLRSMIADKVDSMIRSHDVTTMHALLGNDDLTWLANTDIARMPIEVLSEPDIKTKVVARLKKNIYSRDFDDAFNDQVKEVLGLLEGTSE